MILAKNAEVELKKVKKDWKQITWIDFDQVFDKESKRKEGIILGAKMEAESLGVSQDDLQASLISCKILS